MYIIDKILSLIICGIVFTIYLTVNSERGTLFSKFVLLVSLVGMVTNIICIMIKVLQIPGLL